MTGPLPLDLVVAEQVSRLTAGGVPAAVQLADLNPPGVLVKFPDVAFTFGKASVDYLFTGLLIVPNTGPATALVALGELLVAAQAALAGAITSALAVDVAGIDGAAPAPGYRITWSFTHRRK